MQTKTPQRQRVMVATLVATFVALVIFSASCGGGGTEAVPSTVKAATLNLSPVSLSFGSQPLETSSSPASVTLTNMGNAALTLTSLALTGTNPNDFAQTNNCGSSVAAGANCTISVTFTPSASGARKAALSIADSASGTPQTVSLSGTGGSTATVAGLSPSSLDFGDEPVDIISSAQVVTLNNTGGAALNITSIAFTGANASNFTEADTCSPFVAAGGQCTIAILFRPAKVGTHKALLTITDNASGSPQSVSLSGRGTHDVILTWTPSTTPGIAGYNIFRSENSRESATPLNSSPVHGTTYVDTTVHAKHKYHYWVTAVGSDGITQSPDSNEASADVPSP